MELGEPETKKKEKHKKAKMKGGLGDIWNELTRPVMGTIFLVIVCEH